MTKPTVIVDCDGVLSDFVGAVLPILQRFASSITRDDITTWRVEDSLPSRVRKDATREITECVEKQFLCAHVEPLPGAAEFLTDLTKIAHVIIATSPYTYPEGDPVGAWVNQRGRWLLNFAPEIPHVQIQRKHMLIGDILLDDSIQNCVAWNNTGRQSLLFDAPYNRQVESLFRVRGYEEVLTYIRGLV